MTFRIAALLILAAAQAAAGGVANASTAAQHGAAAAGPHHAAGAFLSKTLLQGALAAEARGVDVDEVGKFHWKLWGPAAACSWFIWLVLMLLVLRFFYTRGVVPHAAGEPDKDPRRTLEHGHFGCADDNYVFLWSCFCPGLRWADTMDMAGVMRFWYALILFAAMALLNYMNFFIVLLVGLVAVLVRAAKHHETIQGVAPEAVPDSSSKRHCVIVLLWIASIGVAALVVLSGSALLAKIFLPNGSGFMDEVLLAERYFGMLGGSFVFGLFTAGLLVHHRQELREKFSMPSRTAEILLEDFCFLFWCPWCGIAQEARAVNEAHEIGHESVKRLSPEPSKAYGAAGGKSSSSASA